MPKHGIGASSGSRAGDGSEWFSPRDLAAEVRQMAVGTSGGLLVTQKATSVFKHEILRQYNSAFLAKVASKSDGHRVMVVDGFAGRGRFEDGSPGSAELFMRAAATLSGVNTSIRLFERSKVDASHLATVAAEYGANGLDVISECADVASRLEATVSEAKGIPLFLFLDPCGQNLPFDLLVKVLAEMRGAKWPPTEALLNLSADFTRRIGGTVGKGIDTAGVETMDRMVGGDWWRQVALDAHAKTPGGTWGEAADAVATGYMERLAKAAGMGGVLVPVRRKPENQPTYHLAYLTRSNHGHWVMADALARARQKWLREVGPQEDDGQGALFDADPVGDLIDGEQTRAKSSARSRVLDVVGRERKFNLIDNVLDVYGTDYGVLTESNLGKAAAELVKDGLLAREPGKKLGQATFTYKG